MAVLFAAAISTAFSEQASCIAGLKFKTATTVSLADCAQQDTPPWSTDLGHRVLVNEGVIFGNDLWSRPDSFIFPKVTRRTGRSLQLDFLQPLSRSQWTRDLRSHFRVAGLPVTSYSGYSFRPGAATDPFNMEVPYPII